jgi:uncharacterized damage-inducible protein DinB
MSKDLRYPIGRVEPGFRLTPENRQAILLEITELPDRLRDAVQDLSNVQLDTPYRPDGWTVRQVVHHLADSHMHWYIRTRFALTENEPAIKAYDENRWALLADARSSPLEPSLALLDGLQSRIAQLLKSLTPEDWRRTFIHPDHGSLSLDVNVPIYAWHGRHHTAHISDLRKRMGWA